MASFFTRNASHASSWYSDRATVLEGQLSGWMQEASKNGASGSEVKGRCCAVIAPHAGFSYSGPTAAFAYSRVDPSKVKRVFILGPSHHYYQENCSLTCASRYATPIGDLEVDLETNEELKQRSPKGTFGVMSREVDEAEHSIEMHLPYVAWLLKMKTRSSGIEREAGFKIIPILVGNLSGPSEREVGQLLAPYLDDEANLFIVSSDFCHWGSRFRFTWYEKSDGAIHESIEKLDRRGMGLIENQDVDGFASYLHETRNTICGRHPIGVMLNALKASSQTFDVTFTRYAQSSQCKRKSDSSVSYASAVVCCTDEKKG